MPYLGNDPGAITDAFTDTFTGDASETNFTLTRASTTNSVFVRIHGVMQRNGTDFTVDGTTLTFTTAPPNASNNIVVQFFTVGSVQEVADNAITLAKMAHGTDGNLITYDAAGAPAAVATGSSGQVLTSAGAGSPPTFATLSGLGKIVQVVNVQDTDAGTSTNVITNDTSIPQISEGTEIMTLAITPTSSSNYLLINVEVNGVDSGGSLDMNVALFQDSTANALGAAVEFIAGGTGTGILFSHYMQAGTTSETTFKVRGGPGASGTMTFTGQHSGASLFGVAMKSSITIWEISA